LPDQAAENGIAMPLKQRISSFLMLSVMLPMVFLAPFHHHDEPAQDDIPCESCTRHQPHAGHLSAQTGTDECLICRLLCQQFFPPVTPAFIAPSSVRLVNTGCFSDDIPLRFNHPFSTRAPPVSFCCPFPASTV
jgi:hypothetical protein